MTIESCPHGPLALARVNEALAATGITGAHIIHTEVSDPAPPDFGGSPTILVDGADPFTHQAASAPTGLTCRIYQTPDGPDGAPTIKQLIDALEAALS